MTTLELFEKILREFSYRVYAGAWTPLDTLSAERIAACVRQTVDALDAGELHHYSTDLEDMGPHCLVLQYGDDDIEFLIEDGFLKMKGTVGITYRVAQLLESGLNIDNLLLLYSYIKLTSVSAIEVGKHMYRQGIRSAEAWSDAYFTPHADLLIKNLELVATPSVYGDNIPTPTWLDLKYTVLGYVWRAFN